MTEVRPMTSLDEEAFRAIGDGYVTSETYRVSKLESPQCWQVELQLVPLPVPTAKVYPDLPEDLAMYSGLLPQGFSFGAWEGSRLVGSLIAERRDWNGSLFIWDIRVADDARRCGIDRQLIDRVVEQARAAGLRIISLETQTLNVPAIRFYRKQGFVIDGVDLSLYTNDDPALGEVCVYMKRRI